MNLDEKVAELKSKIETEEQIINTKQFNLKVMKSQLAKFLKLIDKAKELDNAYTEPKEPAN